MIGQTNSLCGDSGGSGSDSATLVYVIPQTSQTILQDDKVFMQKTNAVATQTYTATLTAATADGNSYVEPYFINDDQAICLAPDTTYSLKYSYSSGSGWQTSALTQTVDSLTNATFEALSRTNCLVTAGKTLMLGADGSFTDLSDGDYYYVGRYYGRDYAISKTNGSLYTYDWSTKQIGSLFDARAYDYLAHGVDEENDLMFVQEKNNKMYVLCFYDDYTVGQRGFSTLQGLIVAYTGLAAGNYVFTMAQTAANYCSPYVAVSDGSVGAGTNGGLLHIYISDGRGAFASLTSASNLYRFHQQSNIVVHYDKRSQVLFIGTTTGVYFYVWDATAQTFSELKIAGITLPTNPNDAYIYNGAVSPNLKNLMIYCGSPYSSSRYVKIFSLSTNGDIWQAVDMTSATTDLDCVYTGIATGQTDSAGRSAAKSVLPSGVTLSVTVSPTPDNFTFLGDE